jgi:acyl-CoA reductase-like NAD-dependent aldehyde dehydrogenase
VCPFLIKALESLEETAAVITAAMRGEIASSGRGQRAYIEREPYGVVLGMAPWFVAKTFCEL